MPLSRYHFVAEKGTRWSCSSNNSPNTQLTFDDNNYPLPEAYITQILKIIRCVCSSRSFAAKICCGILLVMRFILAGSYPICRIPECPTICLYVSIHSKFSIIWAARMKECRSKWRWRLTEISKKLIRSVTNGFSAYPASYLSAIDMCTPRCRR